MPKNKIPRPSKKGTGSGLLRRAMDAAEKYNANVNKVAKRTARKGGKKK